MADRLEAYADWLVANQNKRGTPEFDTVANAYKQLRQQPQQQAIPAREPGVMESLGRGIADRATGIAAGLTELPDTITETVTGYKDPRLLVPGDADQFMGVDWRNIGDTRFVENTPDIQKLENPFGFTGDEFENAGKYLRSVQKDIDYQRITPWNEVKSNPTPQNVLAFMGEAAVTSLPDMAAALLATPAYFASYISPMAEERAKNDGRDQVTPEDLLIAATASLAIAGAERFGAKGIFGGQTGNMVTRPIKAGVRESGTEAIQETTQYGAETAGTQAGFDPAQAADQALAGAVGGFGAGTGLRATTDAVTAIAGQDINAKRVAENLIAKGDVLNPKLVGNDPQAATELATRLDRIAKKNDLNLKDVNKQSTSGAREAIEKAHIQISEELKLFANDLRTQLNITDTDPLAIALDKVLAIAGRREARNKAKSLVGVEEMEAIDRLAGNTQEGQRLLSLMRQMNELTTLHNSGYVGGVSKITDQLSPIPSNVGYSDRSLIETPTRILGTLYGASVNPIIPAIQGAAVIGGRGIDAMTGRRSRVATYIKDNLGNSDGIKISDDAESVRETRRQEAEGIKKANQEQRARAKEIHKSQYEKNGDLPFLRLDAMLKERGLSPKRAVELLEAMAAADPVIAADAKAMIKAIQEGGRTPNMTAVGAAMSTALDQQSTSVTRDKTPVPGAAQAVAAAAPRDVSAGYVRGIQDNQAANTALIEAVDADPTISDDDKAVLIDTLADLRSNLGSNPADRAMDIAAKAESQVSDPALVEAYVMPYVNRVIGQQTISTEQSAFTPVPTQGVERGLLAVPAGETLSNDFTLTEGSQYTLLPFLRTSTNSYYDHPRKILASSNVKNIDKQLSDLDQLLADHPNTLASKEAFMDFLADAMGKANKDGSVPLIPYRALEMVQNPQLVLDQIGGLTEGQKDLAAEGFAAAAAFKEAYTTGAARPDITGKLLLWGMLSRGVSPYIQEAAFLDVVTSRGNKQGIGKFIQDAADGNFNLKEYEKWVNTAMPQSSAGAGTTHNLNAFGKILLNKMSKRLPNGKTAMQHLHDLISNPELSGRDVRREFHRINDKVGINNKVISFMLLVSGRNDVMVLDRVQFRNMFDDGRFKGFNIYDTTKVDKKQIAGSSIQSLGDDTMGLMYYEALERDLMPVVRQAYEDLGRADDFSMGRYHWESWVASSAQEVDHGTINGIINESLGIENPYQSIYTREGRYNTYDSGAVYYYQPDGQAYVAMPDGLGNMYEFTAEQAKSILERIRTKSKKDGIIPADFKVSNNRNRPWYENPQVNKEALAKLYQSEGGRPLDGGLYTFSEANTDGNGTDVTRGSGEDRQVDPSKSYTSVASNKGFLAKLADSFGSRPATSEEVRDLRFSPEQDQQAAIVADYLSKGKPIPIGQKGTPFENGIQNPDAIKKIAEALGVAVRIYLSRKDMAEQQRINHGVKTDDSTLGNLLASSDPRYPLSADNYGEIGVLKEGAVSPYTIDGTVTLQNFIFTLAHELGHVFGSRPAFDVRDEKGRKNLDNWNNIVRISDERNDASGRKLLKGANPVYSFTLDGQLAILIDAASKKPKLVETKTIGEPARIQARQIIEEIKQLQSKPGVLSPYGFEGQPFRVRESYQVFEDSQAEKAAVGGYAAAVQAPKEAKSFARFERTYMNSPAELVADLIASYLINPQRLKQIAPTAAGFARDLLNQSSSSAVAKFYNAPIGVVIAAIIANILVGEREEQEEQGMLNLGRGLLTA